MPKPADFQARRPTNRLTRREHSIGAPSHIAGRASEHWSPGAITVPALSCRLPMWKRGAHGTTLADLMGRSIFSRTALRSAQAIELPFERDRKLHALLLIACDMRAEQPREETLAVVALLCRPGEPLRPGYPSSGSSRPDRGRRARPDDAHHVCATSDVAPGKIPDAFIERPAEEHPALSSGIGCNRKQMRPPDVAGGVQSADRFATAALRPESARVALQQPCSKLRGPRRGIDPARLRAARSARGHRHSERSNELGPV